MVTDADAGTQLVETMLATVADDAKTASLGNHVLQMALRDAAEHIADEVEKIIKSKNA